MVDEQRLALARRLTDRDRQILRAVARHRVLTGDQIAVVFFDGRRRAQERLRDLHRLQILDRFEPLRPAWGRVPFHYVIGRLGAAVLASEAGADPDRAIRRWKADRAFVLGGSQRLAHLLGINAFFAALAAAARRDPDAALVDWMTEDEATKWADRIVRPDAYAVWSEAGRNVDFFVEYDRGTESLHRLAAKLDGYQRLEGERGASSWVLFAVNHRREAGARRALRGAPVPVATGRLDDLSHPEAEVWLPLDGHEGRVRLAELADIAKPPEARARAAAPSVRAWRFARSRPDHEEAPLDPI